MCARSQQSGDISSETCRRCASAGTGASSASVRRRDSSRAATISGFVTTSDLGRGASGPLIEEVVGGTARAADEARRVLLGGIDGDGIGTKPFERVLRGVEAPVRGGRERGIVQGV